MTNEEMERTIQFIVQQQAQFASDLQQMRQTQVEYQAQSKEQFERVNEALIALTGFLGRLAEAQIRTDAKVAHLSEKFAKLSEKLAELAQKGAETEQRLNTFITVVERYISEGRNGNKKRKKG